MTITDASILKLKDWKIFNKAGSQVQLFADPLINLSFNSPQGQNATGYLITDPSLHAYDAEITNSGYLYDDTTSVSYQYTLGSADFIQIPSVNASVNLIDVSIYNPDPQNVQGIGSLSLSLQTPFIYPSTTYAGTLFLKPISIGLVETENLFILQSTPLGFITPYDAVNSTITFQMVGDENQIAFFSIDEDNQEIVWSDTLIYDISQYQQNIPLSINIGFTAQDEGVYERRLRIYHTINNVQYLLIEIMVNAQAIGEDERFRGLISNFGLPDPKNIESIFKESDINEALPDYELINDKSKFLMVEYQNIFPYVGSYKALINALKWLGYDDIYVREWFLNVSTTPSKRMSLVVPFDAPGRTQTLLKFSPEERRHLKKLNQLSLNYCITHDTGEVDDFGVPITANCYAYNLDEILVKLVALKDWLEKNIIGVNCRIVDLTGDGVYYERYQNLIYATQNTGVNLNLEQSLTPLSIGNSSELINGEASINLTLGELTRSTFNNNLTFLDSINYLWDPIDGKVYPVSDTVRLNDPSVLKVGATFNYPINNIQDIRWKVSLDNKEAAVLGNEYVTNPLFVYQNEIKFYNIFDSSSTFFDTSTNLHVILSQGFLRNASIDVWENSIDYSIYPDVCSGFWMESSIGVKTKFNDLVSFRSNPSTKLQYTIDNVYNVPLLLINNFQFTDISGNTSSINKQYILDITEGQIVMENAFNDQSYINFTYDNSIGEQTISLNKIYYSDRVQLFAIDPSVYYWSGPNDPSVYSIDNTQYELTVNHIGDYDVEIDEFDSYNGMFHSAMTTPYQVYIKTPNIYILSDNSNWISNVDVSSYISLSDVSTLIGNNLHPIYDRNYALNGLEIKTGNDGLPYIQVPSISSFIPTPITGSIDVVYNLTEKVLNIVGNQMTVNTNFQSFYSGDSINLVKFSKEKYSLISEASSYIINATGGVDSRVLTLDQVPTAIFQDSSSDIYVQNNTFRSVSNVRNDVSNNALILDVNGYTFQKTQNIGVIISDVSNGYQWGVTLNVVDVSGTTHTLNSNIPQFFIDASNRYQIQVKHAFSTFAEFYLDVSSAIELNGNFNIKSDDNNYLQYFLDNTFTLINIPFDQQLVNQQWYDVSDNLVDGNFYNYKNTPINIDISTLVIFRSLFDVNGYLNNQRNIWTINRNSNGTELMRVLNDSVPFIFNESGYFDVKVESYDNFGNLSVRKWDGLLNVR